MSWSLNGYLRDEPVFRSDEGGRETFFQSGRHAAEERFWKLKIHEDGSFVRRNASSLDNFYTIKAALRATEEKKEEEELKRRQGSVEEESSESSVEEEEEEEDDKERRSERDLQNQRTSKKKTGQESETKSLKRRDEIEERREDLREPVNRKETKGASKPVKAKELELSEELRRTRELERAKELERLHELERRERELEARERDLERRSYSREVSPEYTYNLYKYRSRRNSEISNKDYPYSVCSEYTPSTTTIQEDGEMRTQKSRFREHGSVSTRYF